MVEILMGKAHRYMLGMWLGQDASVASDGVAGEWLRQRGCLNAGARTDMVTGERLTTRASLGNRWGSQVP